MKLLCLAILCLSLASAPALAAKRKAKKVRHDTYSATEEGPSEEVISSAPGYRGEMIPAPSESEPVKLTAPSVNPVADRVTSSMAVPVPAQTAPQFDSVPTSQEEPLVRRLRLVETLVTKYGRAYDYKTLTVTQLQTILGELDAQAAQTAELRKRTETRLEMKKSVESESTDSIGSEAPETAAPFEGGGTGADTVAPVQN